MTRPFVKWAGGKRSLLGALPDAAPKQFDSCYEPFLAAVALFFALQGEGRFRHPVPANNNEAEGNAVPEFLIQAGWAPNGDDLRG